VLTPYQEAELRRLRTAQINDVMILVQANHAPRRLSRTTPTTFALSLFPFSPPPTYEAGTSPLVGLSLSAQTGMITVFAGGSVFLESDVQRPLTAGTGRAVITAVISAASAQATVLDSFDALNYAPGAWTIKGSPVADLTLVTAGTVGSQVSGTLTGLHPGATNLLNPNFTTWTDYSGTFVLATGTHDGPANSTQSLVDVGINFTAAGVLTTHIVHNLSDGVDGSQGIVSSVSPNQVGVSGLLFGGAENDFDIGDTYEIRETGGSRASGTLLELTGGTAGHGWRETAATTVAGFLYELHFTVGSVPIGVQIGSSAQSSDVLAEASYPPGTHAVSFGATSAQSFVQFRNNQNTWGTVADVAVHTASITGFRPDDAGKYIRVHNGLIHISTITNDYGFAGEIVRELDSTAVAPAGAWSLEEPAWSDTLGWPRAVGLYEQRLYLAGTAAFPQTVWGSAVDSFSDFFAGPLPSDAVEFPLVDSGGNITLNVLQWILPAENLMTGSSHGEYRLIGSGDDPITAVTPPRARIQSSYGSDDLVMPIKVDQAIIFPQRQGSKLREITLDPSGATRYLTRDLTVLADHLLARDRIVELAYSSEPLGTVWAVRSDGVVLGLTYDTREEIAGWWQWHTAGQIESLAVIPHPSQNRQQIWMSVARQTGRFIEIVEDETPMIYDPVAYGAPTPDNPGAWEGLTVDAAVLYDHPPTTTLAGLGHLENLTVDIVANGAVFPSQVVQGGQVVLPTASPPLTAFVGLHFEASGELLPPELSQQTIQRSKKRWVELLTLVNETVGLTLQGEIVTFRTAEQAMDRGVHPYTGEKHVPARGWDRDGRITFAQPQPLPARVLGIIGLVDVEVER
jgi:hypothetical protein